jgi:hypothetical protein
MQGGGVLAFWLHVTCMRIGPTSRSCVLPWATDEDDLQASYRAVRRERSARHDISGGQMAEQWCRAKREPRAREAERQSCCSLESARAAREGIAGQAGPDEHAGGAGCGRAQAASGGSPGLAAGTQRGAWEKEGKVLPAHGDRRWRGEHDTNRTPSAGQ